MLGVKNMNDRKQLYLFPVVAILVGLFSIFITITTYKAFFDVGTQGQSQSAPKKTTPAIEDRILPTDTTPSPNRVEVKPNIMQPQVPSENSIKYDDQVKQVIDRTNKYISAGIYNEFLQKELYVDLRRLFSVAGLSASQNIDLKAALVKLEYFGRLTATAEVNRKTEAKAKEVLSEVRAYLNTAYDKKIHDKLQRDLNFLLSKKPGAEYAKQINNALHDLAIFKLEYSESK